MSDTPPTQLNSLSLLFKAYCELDPISTDLKVELLPLSQIDKWLREAKVLDMKNITTTDTGVCFFEFRKRAISYEEFLQYLQNLADSKGMNINELKRQLQKCSKPSRMKEKNKKSKSIE